MKHLCTVLTVLPAYPLVQPKSVTDIPTICHMVQPMSRVIMLYPCISLVLTRVIYIMVISPHVSHGPVQPPHVSHGPAHVRSNHYVSLYLPRPHPCYNGGGVTAWLDIGVIIGLSVTLVQSHTINRLTPGTNLCVP